MFRVGLLTFCLCALVPPLGAQGGRAGRPLKVYISADMEGVVGSVTPDQLGPGGFEYERYRGFMTAEVNAAIAAAKSAGATQIVVSDSHGNGENLLIEELPEDVTVVRSWPRPLMMMQGIDSTFHAAIFIGYHASAVSPRGVRAHTISSARLQDVRLNGRSMPEGGINAAIAGYFGVPVVMVSGDDVAVGELRALLGDVEAAVVKRALSFHSAETVTPEAASRLIGEKVATALRQLERFKPFVVAPPVALELRFKHYRPAEMLAYLPMVERVDAYSVRYVGADILAVSRFLEFVTTYAFTLEP